MQCGEDRPTAKLTEQAVRDIRQSYRAGFTQASLAAHHEVSQMLISLVVRRKIWKHVE